MVFGRISFILNQVKINAMKQKNKFKLGSFRGCQNFGDAINKVILKYLNISYEDSNYSECDLLAIGSVLNNVITDREDDCDRADNNKINIWGSGFIKRRTGREKFIRNVNICALRGKYSKMRCENALGYKLSGITLGDPGILISRVLPFKNIEKKYDVGIILHYVDKGSGYLNNIKLCNKKSCVIDIQDNPEKICKQINECKMILSSAMHGLVAADSYGIPNKWIRLSDDVVGGNYKFDDYYSAYGIYGEKPVDLREKKILDSDIDKYINGYDIIKNDVEKMCDSLERAFPFRPSISAKNRKYYKSTDVTLNHVEPKVSVIVPCYNHGKYLMETLNSVLNQTYHNWECIIVDDGSVDETGNIAKNYCKKDSRFKYIFQENSGPSKARNFGIKNSDGDYILPLDADDLISRSYILEAIRIFSEDNDVKLVYCKAEFFDEKSGEWILPEYLYSELLYNNMIFCSAIYRRSDYDKTTGYNEKMRDGFEDWDFWIELLDYSSLVYRLPSVHFYYRIKNNSRNKDCVADVVKLEKMLYQIYCNHSELYKNNPIFYRRLLDKNKELLQKKEQEIDNLEELIERKNKEIDKKNKEIDKIKNSKSFKIGSLFFRSVKSPWKMITFPVNFLYIIFRKKR